ncbi:SDR family oxidoreductase [Amycolatopsis sp. K13G38]|uniref:SDR family oxidoreductase n=1 Tax=Amycolatopsis acididurans TaxID=2724524 RepID=A0ABX1J9E0_9PSEU|nr:SDR family oxidoreductase [Amycolatopsis acididurans]NKQ55509.1 SDR family oxidoreductase [Amycolatopsis acididurans]
MDNATKAELTGKVALITGATSGVGLLSALRLAERGATVVVNGRSAERGAEAMRRLGEVTDRASFAAGDCADYDSIAAVASRVVDDQGAIDLLISAGAQGEHGPTPFAEMTGDELTRAFTSRFFPRIYPVHAALPGLRVRGGAVVMLTTDAARTATSGESIMGASGAGVILMTKTLAKELARWKVRVNSVAMTITAGTPSWDRIFATESFQQRLFEKAVARFPWGSPPDAGNVADAVVFLASGAAGQVTGQTLSVNGGLSFGGW